MSSHVLGTAALLAALAIWRQSAGAQEAPPARDATAAPFYVGTYTDGESRGIYLGELDAASGAVRELGLAAEAKSPSFLAIHPNQRFLYAVSEAGGGAVAAFAIDPTSRRLTRLNEQSSQGAGPCHLTVDGRGRHALVANYGSGSVAVLPIGDDGKLGPATCTVQHQGKSVDPDRQEGPHAHSIYLGGDERLAFVADLGLDKVLCYRFDPTKGTLAANDPPGVDLPAGAGPRHLAFHPNGRWVYSIDELDSTVTAFGYDAERGALTRRDSVSTLPAGAAIENTTAEIEIEPSGRFLYASNRGADSIAAFAIDPSSGRLTALGQHATGGKTPRHFAIDPSGRWLLAANQNSGTITVHRIDPQTGQLEDTGQTCRVPSPVCILMLGLGDKAASPQ